MGQKLLEATREGQVDSVRELVVNLSAPFTSDWLGTTALHVAAQNGHAEIAEILLKGGVNRDARTKLERTALHLAAQNGCLEVVDLLITYGADINSRDMLKMTPLHWAVQRRHARVVEKLLFAGADASVKSKFKLAPIDIARQSEFYEIYDMLQSWTKHDVAVKLAQSDNDQLSDTYGNLESTSSESRDMLDIDYHLALAVGAAATSNDTNPSNNNNNNDSVLGDSDHCIDFVEFEWNKLDIEPDLFMPNSNNNNCANDDQEKPKVEYLKKVVEELQKENKQLKKKVQQLSTTSQC